MIYIVLIIWLIVISAEIVLAENRIKMFVGDALCELMTAVYNADAVKAKCQEAAEKGEKYVELDGVVE